MQTTLTRFEWPALPPLEELARLGVVFGCALALICAGPLLPF